MCFTIDFDSKSCFETGEVETILQLRMLAAEAKAGGVLTQLLPQKNFLE